MSVADAAIGIAANTPVANWLTAVLSAIGSFTYARRVRGHCIADLLWTPSMRSGPNRTSAKTEDNDNDDDRRRDRETGA